MQSLVSDVPSTSVIMPLSKESAAQPVAKRIEVFAVFSRTLDHAAGRADGHAIRAAWLGYHVGRELSFSTRQLADLLTVILLKDIGVGAWAVQRMAASTRERVMRRLMRPSDAATGPAAADPSHEDSALLDRAGPGLCLCPTTIKALRAVRERWDGLGGPDRLEANMIPLASAIALTAETADIAWTQGGRPAAVRAITRRSGRWFSPDVVAAFERAARSIGLWTTLTDPCLPKRVVALEPPNQTIMLDNRQLDEFCLAFADIVELRARFAAGRGGQVPEGDLIADRTLQMLREMTNPSTSPPADPAIGERSDAGTDQAGSRVVAA